LTILKKNKWYQIGIIQGKTESVMKFFGRYEKALATYKLYEGLTYEQELKSLLDKLRIEMQMALRIYMRIKPFKSIEDIIDSVKTIEQAAGIKDEPAVHVARKEERIRTDPGRLEREFFQQGRLLNSPRRRSGSSGDGTQGGRLQCFWGG